MFKLRQTWASILPNQKLYMIDVRINNLMDPAWPITAMPPEQTSIHVNPKFLPKVIFVLSCPFFGESNLTLSQMTNFRLPNSF